MTGLLQCTGFVPFWLAISHGVTLGSGLPLGDVILQHVSDHMTAAKVVSVAGTTDQITKWQIPFERSKYLE